MTVEYMGQVLSQPSCKPETDCYLAESRESLVDSRSYTQSYPSGER